jgi:3-oxoacyl-[acyl-carrier-protein] synthase III
VTRAAVPCGLGGRLPPRIVTNHDLPAELDSSDEWIRSRTGIHRRHVGNTAASIPLALAQGVADGGIQPGHRILVTAFGGSLTWGSALLTWPDLATANG